MNATEKLNTLAEYQAQRDLLALERERLLREAIPADVRALLDEIEAEFGDKTAAVDEKINELDAEIRQDVLAAGATAKGEFLQAVYTGGRVTWDTKYLNGMAAAIPEINNARKVSDPSVAIRKV